MNPVSHSTHSSKVFVYLSLTAPGDIYKKLNVVRSGSSYISLEGLSLRLDDGSRLNVLLYF